VKVVLIDRPSLELQYSGGNAELSFARRNQAEAAYVIWDECVLEESESLKPQSLCVVGSTKAARLKRIKPGFFDPPTGRPIFVPGFHCLQILVIGLRVRRCRVGRGRVPLSHDFPLSPERKSGVEKPLSTPLYRLRLVLSRSWLTDRPHSLPPWIRGTSYF